MHISNIILFDIWIKVKDSIVQGNILISFTQRLFLFPNYNQYNIAGSSANLSVGARNSPSKYDTYPSQGGYILMAIDPNIPGWADSVNLSGTFNPASVIWYAVLTEHFNELGTIQSTTDEPKPQLILYFKTSSLLYISHT